MDEQKKIKIYISCHKPCEQVKNDIFTPVMQKDVVDFLRKGAEEDKFMAERANEYCELLTQYWAWKYEEADYYGFGHYRRYFEFADDVKSNAYCMVRRDYLNARTARELGLTDEARIRSAVESADVLTPVPFNYYIKSVYWQYKNSGTLYIEDLDIVLDIIREEFPQYLAAAEKYLRGHYMYACNMFVMRADLFKEYSAWLFAVLRRFYERRDMAARRYSNEAMRTPGHLGERLFGVFCTYLVQRGGVRFGRRRMVQFANTDPAEELSPAFAGEETAIFMPISAGKSPLAAAALSSVMRHAGEGKYDIVLLADGMGAAERAKLASLAAGKENFSLRFYDLARMYDECGLSSFGEAGRLAYAQLSLPRLFPAYARGLWLDCDVIAGADVAALAALDLGGACAGGAPDFVHAGEVNGFSGRIRSYYLRLGLPDLYALVQPGVLVMDFAAMREACDPERLYACAGYPYRDARKDILNLLLGGKLALFGGEWNSIPEEEGSDGAAALAFAPKEVFLAAQAAGRSAKLLHFCGSERPWETPASAHAAAFWEALRATPFWEELLFASGRGGKKKERGVVFRWIFLKLFPYGSRRRSALKKIFKRKR